MKQYSITALLVWATSSVFGAVIEWDAGGDGNSTFQEANWVVTDNTGQPGWTIGEDPPDGTVNGATDVPADAIVGGSATAGGGAGAGNHYDLASGTSLTVRDDARFRLNTSQGRGIRGINDAETESLVIQDNARVIAQFLLHMDVSLSGNAELVLNGGGDPINQSFIDLASDWTGTITLNNEMVADWSDPGSSNPDQPAHIEDITVDGQPAVIGVNVGIVSDGGTGSILFIPEPAASLMLGVGALFMMRRRR